jgi:peptide-methionine (S)-S-oxide reductase
MTILRFIQFCLVLVASAFLGSCRPADAPETASQPVEIPEDTTMATATFAAGCFWGVEDTFRGVPGVSNVTVGYTGGHTENPSYEQVCSHTTGHAEAVLVQYDPDEVSYEDLLDTFWSCHDPTQLNRQGPDVGSQYRSAIFYHTPEQREAAERSKRALEAADAFGGRPIATEITEASTFWRAEEYHQRYLEKRGRSRCRAPRFG